MRDDEDTHDGDVDTLLGKLAATTRHRPPLHLVGTKRFELRRKLGVGAFGDVYEARDRVHGTLVALKSLRSSHPDWIYRFKREFRVVGDLAHPNLVQMYELFCENDSWYLTMELVDGRRLDEYVRRAPDRLRSCFGQLALAIIELHRAGCLHRDLKPSNALVESTGRVVLLDFGLAVERRAGARTVIAGTPPYMAPEVGLGDVPIPASDWYSFGVMLYQALAGVLPYTGPEVEILAAKMAGPPPPPSSHRPDVDPALEALALRLLARLPGERPDADEILRVLGGDQLAFDPPSWRGTPPALVGRSRELASLEAAFDAMDDAPTVVTVSGAPGTGKSTLLSYFLERLRARGITAYQSRCLELEAVPFKGVDGAIDVLCNDLRYRPREEVEKLAPHDLAALLQMFPVLKRIDAFSRGRSAENRMRSPQETRQAATEALRELLQRMAGTAPLVLFVDDLQWTSDDSARLLLELLRPPAPRILLIVAHRAETEGTFPALDRFLQGFEAHRVRHVALAVDVLDRDAVAELLAAHGSATVTADQALAETGGHPYLLARLLESESRTSEQPVDLTEVLVRELEQLDPDARLLLELISVAGGPIGQPALYAAADLKRNPAALELLRRRKLVHASGATTSARVEPYHDRVREATFASISTDRRRELHLRLAIALETDELVEPETLAHHYRGAGQADRALEWTQRAAERATATLAFARAVELYTEARALTLDDAQQLEVLERLAEAQVQSGRRSDAGATCLEAAELASRCGDATRHAALRAQAGEHFLLAGQVEYGLELIGDALAEVDVTMPRSPAVAVAESFNLGGALVTRGLAFRTRREDEIDPVLLRRLDLELQVARALTLSDIRAPLMATRALLDALDAGDPVRVQRALAVYVHTTNARAPGDPFTLAAETQAHELAADLGDELGAAWAELATGFHAMQREDHLLALEMLERAERRFLAAGPVHVREATLARNANIVVSGTYGVDVPRARRRRVGCIEESLARGDLFNAAWARLFESTQAIMEDDIPRARERLAQVRAAYPQTTDSMFSVVSMVFETELAIYEDPARAWDRVARLDREFGALFSSLLPLTRGVWCRLSTNAAMTTFVAGRASLAETRDRIDAILEHGAAVGVQPQNEAVALAHRHRLAGDRAAQLAELERAVEVWKARHQDVFAHLVQLRIYQAHGDESRARAEIDTLVARGVADPDHYADVLAGPR